MLHASVSASSKAHSSAYSVSPLFLGARIVRARYLFRIPFAACREVSKKVAIFFGIQRGFILSTNPSASKLFNRLLS
jgi:hypothetical protein